MALSEKGASVPYSAYYRRDVPDEDKELTHVGPGTPCGEYFRRFWQPVGLSGDLKDLPRRVRILGEDLVLFRTGRGQVGLLQLQCSHRGTSLEFGTVERRGIRCCYHGWLYGVDGAVLETPGEPRDDTFLYRFYHGAYPVQEYNGLVFAYMGPLDQRPEFPNLDSFEMPGYRAIAHGQWDPTPCNWLQLTDNNMDPVHTVFLHRLEDARAKLDQYRPSVDESHTWEEYVGDGLDQWEEEVSSVRDMARQRVLEWEGTPHGMVYVYTRRVGDMVWVRVADFIPPNIDQIPRNLPAAEEGEEMLFDPPRTTTWTVPVDDTNTVTFGFRYVPEQGTRASRFQFTGASVPDRSYEDRQRQPGDFEGQVSQGPIAVHAREHLAWGDTGVINVRRLVRDGIHAVGRGEQPAAALHSPLGPVPTYARNTVLRIPPARTPEEDRELLRSTARRVMAGEFPKR